MGVTGLSVRRCHGTSSICGAVWGAWATGQNSTRTSLGTNCSKELSPPPFGHKELIFSRDWYRRLKPDGILELVEIDLEPHWDNGKTIPPNHPLKRWFDTVLNATTQAGRSIGWRHDTLHMLRSQGFIDIRTEVIRLPITSRPSSCHAKTQALSEFYTEALIASLEPLALGSLTQSLGWPALSVRQFADVVQKTLLKIIWLTSVQ